MRQRLLPRRVQSHKTLYCVTQVNPGRLPSESRTILFEGASTLARQIFQTKSIDKLISESERPEHALKKTLGPVSLTALGIGAVIGSGIFTVIGTAIGGNPAKP